MCRWCSSSDCQMDEEFHEPVPVDSISRLVNYVLENEADFFEEMKESGETFDGDENMVYTHAQNVEKWLENP